MDPEEEQFRMNHAGLVARSTAGHAARGMKIKDQDDMWVSIQHHTFRNWVNVQLRETGLKVEDLSEDLRDGVALVTLVESLQKRKLRKVKKVMNQHQALENVTTALTAIADDGIKLVNIGNVDIVNGNLKLILGLVWSLIAHYQIGQSKFPPKKLMHSWLKAVLPDCRTGNFTSDWNSGVNLSALVDYCKPGLFRNWRNLDPNNGTENCRRAMEIAKKEFNIPMVLEPEYLSSPYLDDLSGMTYLSYFMKEGGPGYTATLDWVRNAIPECNVKNFTTDWNDGHALSTLVKKLGGPVPGYKGMDKDPNNWERNLQIAQDGGRKLGVEPVLVPADMSRRDVEYLGPMAYIAHYQWIPAREPASEAIRVKCDLDHVRVNNPVPFRLDYVSNEVVRSEVRVQVSGPQGPIRNELNFGPRGAKGEFTPTQVGFYEITVFYEEETVEGCPVKVRVLPDVTKVMVEGGLEPCALGSIVEVLINSNGSGRDGEMDVKAYAPSRRVLDCPINNDDGVFTANFQPDEPGEWSIAVTYEDQHIQGSPFHCHVYDPNAIQILNLDDGPRASTGKPFTLLIDSAACGHGDVKVDVTLAGKSQPSKTLEVDQSLYEVTFTPFEKAKYKVYVYFNGHEVKGSPFSLYLGIEKPPERKSKARKVKKSGSSKDSKDVQDVVKEYATTRHRSGSDLLVKTFDSSLDRSLLKKSNNINNNNTSYNSLNRSSDSAYNSSTLNSTSKSFESSSSSKIASSSFEDKAPHTPRIISFNFGPESKAQFDLNKNANGSPVSPGPTTNGVKHLASKSLYSSQLNSSSTDVVDSSYNSVFNHSTTSTVINTAENSSNHRGSSLFKKESSPARITNWSSRNDSRSSMSPPPLSPTPRLIQASPPPPLRPSTPVGEVGEAGPNLSAPSRVAHIAKTAPKTNEGKSFFYSSVANMKILPSTF